MQTAAANAQAAGFTPDVRAPAEEQWYFLQG